jgi:hypothetical protein
VRVQHPWRVTSGIVVAALVALAAYAGWLLWSAGHQLAAAAEDASAVKAAALGDDPGRVKDAIADFADHASSAAGATDSPVWSLMTHLPAIGDDARGVRTVSRVADDLAGNGLDELADAAGDIDALLPQDGGIDVSKVQSLVEPVADGHAALDEARDALAQEDPSGFTESLKLRYRDLQGQIADAADAMGVADRALRVMPQMLGADGKRNYLLIMQNNAEIRATGGLPGAVSLVTADHGRIQMVREVSAVVFGHAPAPVLPLAAGEREVFGDNLGRYFQDANLTPDFPRSADLWKARWEQTQPERVDGVISLDTVTLSYLLTALGPVDVDGVHLTSDNVVDELLSKVYARLPDPAAQDAFFAKVASTVFASTMSFDGDRKALLTALGRAADERRMLIHDFDDAVQQQFDGSAVSGDLSSPAETMPQVGVYFGDGTLSKMSYYLRYDAQVRATSCVGGVQRYTARVTLRSTAPKDARTTLPVDVTGSTLPANTRGEQLVVVYAFAPEGGTSSRFDDNDIDLAQFDAEIGGRKVIVTWVPLKPGDVKDLNWTMSSKAGQTGATHISVTPSVERGTKSTTVGSAC